MSTSRAVITMDPALATLQAKHMHMSQQIALVIRVATEVTLAAHTITTTTMSTRPDLERMFIRHTLKIQKNEITRGAE
jgi:hypothetical protein